MFILLLSVSIFRPYFLQLPLLLLPLLPEQHDVHLCNLMLFQMTLFRMFLDLDLGITGVCANETIEEDRLLLPCLWHDFM
jgi:hypothetical protein